jgi:hypothetical protein
MTECQAGCGVELHPAAVAGGFTVHPGCEPRATATEYRWGCGNCLETGRADNPQHAAALEQEHKSNDCPATALVLDDPDEMRRVRAAQRGELIAFRPDVSFRARMERREALARLYPDEVPPYTKPFRPE